MGVFSAMKQLAWAVMVVLAAAPGRADADCGLPRWFGAVDGSTLPVQGSVYLHHEVMARFGTEGAVLPQPIFRWTGAASTLAVHQVSDVVVRIDYDAPHAFGAELAADSYDDWDLPRVTFDRAWTAPAKLPRVVQYWHDVSSWACSSTDTVTIQLDQPVAAVRVRWTFRGQVREWIEVPRSDEPTKSVLKLGKLDCGSTTVDPEELAVGGHLALIAIRADRSEVAVTGLPAFLSSKEMPADEGDRTMHLASLLPAEAAALAEDGLLRGEEDRRVPATVAAPANDRGPGPGLGAIVLGLFALGGILAFRFRVRTPTSVP